MFRSGPHFVQIPGPSNVPGRVLRQTSRPTMDHRSKDFGEFALVLLERVKRVFKTDSPVIIYPGSGTGSWEAALVNTLSPGDRVLLVETGQFSTLWGQLAERMGLEVELQEGDWRSGADPQRIEDRLRADTAASIKAVLVVHNETSTGVTSRIEAVRAAMDAAAHPALLMVDAVSSLASVDYRHDEWRVDVTISGSQKGLMLPPGLGFNAISDKAREASRSAGLPRAYWDWESMLAQNATGFFPSTPATNLLYGLSEALDMLDEEGLENVFARHRRLAAATRAAVVGWGFEVLCRNPAEYSPVNTSVLVPGSLSADRLRAEILAHSNIALGNGLGRLHDTVFRIGHLGEINHTQLMGVLAGVELGLHQAGAKLAGSGLEAAMRVLRESAVEQAA